MDESLQEVMQETSERTIRTPLQAASFLSCSLSSHHAHLLARAAAAAARASNTVSVLLAVAFVPARQCGSKAVQEQGNIVQEQGNIVQEQGNIVWKQGSVGARQCESSRRGGWSDLGVWCWALAVL